MNWDLETKLGCPVVEMALEWGSGKEAGEFMLVAAHSKELGRREHDQNPILAFPKVEVLFHQGLE